MRRTRVIPVLLLRRRGAVKTTKFRRPQYVGDPINTIRIFNDKCVDELVVLDICATAAGHGPDLEFIRELASECFMPLCYGGGVSSLEDAVSVLRCGVEKVAVNSVALDKPGVLDSIASECGSQSLVVSIDVKKDMFGRSRVAGTAGGVRLTRRDPVEYAQEVAQRGAGEILLASVDRDGTGNGYDVDLVRRVAAAVSIPVVACGGAGGVGDFSAAIEAGASAVAAGRLFVFHGRHSAVLVSYPTEAELAEHLP